MCRIRRCREVIWKTWEEKVTHLTHSERALLLLLNIGLVVIVSVLTAYFVLQVLAANRDPILSRSTVRLTNFPRIDLAVIEVRKCTAYVDNDFIPQMWTCDDGTHRGFGPDSKIPVSIPATKVYDFALSKTLIHSDGSGDGMSFHIDHSYFIRPLLRSIRSFTTIADLGFTSCPHSPFYHGELDPCYGHTFLQVRLHNVPFPMTFDTHGAQQRRDGVECKDYREHYNPTWTPPASLSGTYGPCNYSMTMDDVSLNIKNSTTCGVDMPFNLPSPSCNNSPDVDAWSKRFQRDSSWPNSFYMVPVESSESRSLFVQLSTALESWFQQANASLIDPGGGLNDITNPVTPEDIGAKLQNLLPQGAWVSLNPAQPVQRQQITFSSSSCAGVDCFAVGKHNLSATNMGFTGWYTGGENRIVFVADLDETAIRGSIVFTWRMALPLLASYFMTGLNVIAFFFPDKISVGYFYRWGSWIKNQAASPEGTGLSAAMVSRAAVV